MLDKKAWLTVSNCINPKTMYRFDNIVQDSLIKMSYLLIKYVFVPFPLHVLVSHNAAQ